MATSESGGRGTLTKDEERLIGAVNDSARIAARILALLLIAALILLSALIVKDDMALTDMPSLGTDTRIIFLAGTETVSAESYTAYLDERLPGSIDDVWNKRAFLGGPGKPEGASEQPGPREL